MSETTSRAPLGQPDPDLSPDEREAFIRRKIEAALAETRDRSKMIPDHEVWRGLGLEP